MPTSVKVGRLLLGAIFVVLAVMYVIGSGQGDDNTDKNNSRVTKTSAPRLPGNAPEAGATRR